MLSRIIKISVSVISLSLRLLLITPPQPRLFWISQQPHPIIVYNIIGLVSEETVISTVSHLKGNQFLVVTRCHDSHVGDPKHRTAAKLEPQTNQTLQNWVLFRCKLSLVFWLKNKAADIRWLKTSLESLQQILDFWNDIPFPLGVCPSPLSSLFVCFLLPVVANEQIIES